MAYTFLKAKGYEIGNSLVDETKIDYCKEMMEKAESLEQLRWLQNGYRIRVGITNVETIGIDTPKDLERAEAFIAKKEV